MGQKKSKFVKMQDDTFHDTDIWLKCMCTVSRNQGIVIYVPNHRTIAHSSLYFKALDWNYWPDSYCRTVCWFGIEYIKVEGALLTLVGADKRRIRFALPPCQLVFVNKLMQQFHLKPVSDSVLVHFLGKRKLLGMRQCSRLLKQHWPVFLINTRYIGLLLDAEATELASGQSRSEMEAIIGRMVHELIRHFTANLALMKRDLKKNKVKFSASESSEIVVALFDKQVKKGMLQVKKTVCQASQKCNLLKQLGKVCQAKIMKLKGK